MAEHARREGSCNKEEACMWRSVYKGAGNDQGTFFLGRGRGMHGGESFERILICMDEGVCM